MSANDIYRFEFSNNQISAIYEWDDGYWERERIDWNESFEVDGNDVLKIEQEGNGLFEVTRYSALDQINFRETEKYYTSGALTNTDRSYALPTIGANFDDDNYNASDDLFSYDDHLSGLRELDDLVEGQFDSLHPEREDHGDFIRAFDVDDLNSAGGIYRLYEAAFDREPDLEGLGFWISKLDKGTDIGAIADGFVGSQEFIAKYGYQINSALNAEKIETIVEGFYANVLNRKPDQGGKDFWCDRLETEALTVSEVLIGFADSPENRANLLGVLSEGCEYLPFVA